MDIETVRNLIQLMVDNDLAELEVQDGDNRIALKRQGERIVTQEVAGLVQPMAPAASSPGQPAEDETAETPAETAPPDDDENLLTITSPMVGTFYASQDPESPAFVQVGTDVEAETVVCIIEAMKVYNEIKAEVHGVIEQVLVRNEEPVEFGQPLFVVRSTP